MRANIYGGKVYGGIGTTNDPKVVTARIGTYYDSRHQERYARAEIIIGPDVMKRMGWKNGDRVDVTNNPKTAVFRITYHRNGRCKIFGTNAGHVFIRCKSNRCVPRKPYKTRCYVGDNSVTMS